jgi:Glycosyltransferase
MVQLGVFVGENNWTFFKDIYEEMSTCFETRVFKRREFHTPLYSGKLNHLVFSRDIQELLNHCDVCFFEWASDLLAAASHMSKRCRIITRLHSFELYEWAPRINWNNVDKIVVLSQAMRSMFVELYPEQAQKLVIIHNGCSLDRFNFFPDKDFTFTLGMLSTITPIKRIYEVVLMLNELVNLGYPATLRIAGNPDNDERYAVAIQRLVKKLNLQDHVFFDGFIHDTPAWLQKIDVLISNSYWEGQQTALIEALASGCYCLAHFWNGVDEMLPPDHIYVTENELMKKIISYAQLPELKKTALRSQMRTCAQEMFDINSTKEKIFQVIKQEHAQYGSI